MDKQTKEIPRLVNPQNFKIKKPKIIDPEITFKKNSWYLNFFLIIIFIVFLIFFLFNCKDGIFSGDSSEPVPYSLAYNLK
jgi:hypothetical protein